MRIRHLTCLGALFAAIGLLAGCSSSEQISAPDSVGTGQFQLLLVDAPADFDDVILDVQGVSVHKASDDESCGWHDVGVAPAEFHLLELTNGLSALIGDANLPAGPYNQVRLLLGENNRVIAEGEEHELFVPASTVSGLKIQHEFHIEEEKAYAATMDIDASRAVHLAGDGTYILYPMLRIQANAEAGNVAGTIFPPSARALVWTTIGTETVSTYADPVTGGFQLSALPVGTYTVNIDPTVDGFYGTVVVGVCVEAEVTANLGLLFLNSF